MDSSPAIFEVVLRLRGGACEQSRGQEYRRGKKPFHHDLLSRGMWFNPTLRKTSQRDLYHFQQLSRQLAALVQRVARGSLIGRHAQRPFRKSRFLMANPATPSQNLLEPGGVDLLVAAVLVGDVQPLVDKSLQRDVALQPVGLLGEIERLVGMHGAEHAGMQL